MNLRCEVSIDIDPNRKIWITGSAGPVEPGQVTDVAAALTESVTSQALEAHKAMGMPVGNADAVLAAARAGDPSERKPRPEDKASMATFGEEEEDEDAT
jgi:hypothetical protein